MSVSLDENQCNLVFDVLEILQGSQLEHIREILFNVEKQINIQYRDAISKENYQKCKSEFAKELFDSINSNYYRNSSKTPNSDPNSSRTARVP